MHVVHPQVCRANIVTVIRAFKGGGTDYTIMSRTVMFKFLKRSISGTKSEDSQQGSPFKENMKDDHTPESLGPSASSKTKGVSVKQFKIECVGKAP